MSFAGIFISLAVAALRSPPMKWWSAFLLVASAPAGGAAVEPATRPNVLLIISEDHGPQLGCYGDPFARTPHLDALAAGGARFDRAYITQAGCSPSRASILTGLYPHQNGQIGLATWGYRMYRDDTPNIPRSLKVAGYRTGRIGKLHVNPASAFPYDMEAIPDGNFKRKKLGDYARHAEEFFNAGEEPFFLHINYPEAHDPFLTQVDGLPKKPLTAAEVKALPFLGIDPPELREIVADYYNCLSRLDSLVGDLLAALERSGKADNTMVIFVSDHGPDMMRGKRSCYEGGTHVPLLIRWPGKAAPQVRRELVSAVDLMPTILEATGAAPVPGLPGSSLRQLLEGEQPPWRDHVFTEFHTHAARANFFPQRAVRSDRYKLIENLLADEPNPDMDKINKEFPFLAAAVSAAPETIRAAYELQDKPPRHELYDLESDPYEFRNLAASPDHATILTDLQAQLMAWREATQDPLLDPANLQRLKQEVMSLKDKSHGRQRDWEYPRYFFAEDAESTGEEKKHDK